VKFYHVGIAREILLNIRILENSPPINLQNLILELIKVHFETNTVKLGDKML